MEILGNIRNTVANAFSTTSPTPAVTKLDVVGMEESERSRRINQVSQQKLDKENAASVSGIIKTQSFPVFRGNVSKGYKRVTTKFEEEERRRRLTNKSESSLRRANANKTSRMVQELGWPFYQQNHSGAEYLVMDPTKILEEEEREWRTSDSYWGPTAKHNAAMVANILRWGNFQKNPSSGFGRHLSFLTEKERTYRINNAELGMQNAYNEASNIKRMGAPFYVQEQPLKRDFSATHKLEEQERKRRMINPEEQQLAHELAGLVGSHFHPRDNELEEQERGRRITDKRQQKIAKENARNVSLMVRESSQNKITGAGPMWFSISRNSMKALEEIERTRRLRDIEGQRFAKQQAKLISNMVSGKLAAPAKPSIHTIEEGERQARIYDRAGQQNSIKNARKVSGLIARHMLMSSGSKSFALALEESERTRRVQDKDAQNLARDNARKVSSLVSTLNVAPGNKSSPATSLPTYSAPVSAAPTAVDIPRSAPIAAAPVSAPISVAPVAPLAKAPIAAAPVSAPISVAPVAPLAKAPIAAAPVAPLAKAPLPALPALPLSAPVSVAPVSAPISVAPISAPIIAAPVSAPITSAPISAAPISAPISSPMQPIVLPTTSAPIPVAPLATTIPIAAAPVRSTSFNTAPVAPVATTIPTAAAPVRSTSFTTVPVDAAATAHAALGDKERKRLAKQADKHNKQSDKAVRKAEAAMLKAEKLHQKGRDDKAAKLESKAEGLMKNAEHERRWASGIQGELSSNAPAPASM